MYYRRPMWVLTLAAYDFHPHTRVSVPVNGVELDEPGDDRTVQVRMLHRVGINVTLEHLQNTNIITSGIV